MISPFSSGPGFRSGKLRRTTPWVAAALFLAALLGSLFSTSTGAAPQDGDPAPSEILDVSITSPQPGIALFGEVDFTVDVYPPDSVAKVDFYVDGRLEGEVDTAPFTLRVDVGQENIEHRFEIKASSHAGQVAEALLVSPAIRVDSEVAAELQQLYVTVTRDMSRVLNLEQTDFAVVDNGDLQNLVTFARGDVRLTAAILIDSSASMVGDRLRYALRGAKAFVDSINSEDDASIFLFSDRLLHSTPFSNDTQVLTAGLDDLRASGGTALNDHLYLGLKLLEHQQGRRVVVLLSDGIDSHSALRMNEVTWLARRSRALIYWLRTDPTNEAQKSRSSAWKDATRYQTEYEQLRRTVLESGGRILTLRRIQDAESAFRDVLNELREQYVLGYYPTVSRGDGTWHRVRVRVRQSGLQVRTRGGYVDY